MEDENRQTGQDASECDELFDDVNGFLFSTTGHGQVIRAEGRADYFSTSQTTLLIAFLYNF